MTAIKCINQMTRIIGRTIIVSPCGKSLYATPRYASMNFMAYGYWTDGDKEHSLMPTDGGLRMCQCGTAFLLQNTIRLDIDAGDEIMAPKHVEFAQLPQIIATTKSSHVEVTARRNNWRGLNDEYRASIALTGTRSRPWSRPSGLRITTHPCQLGSA